jgi:hypothetical protein
VRAGLRKIFDADEAISVAGEVEDGLGAVEAAARLDPDVVVMDIRMPTVDSLEALLDHLDPLPSGQPPTLVRHPGAPLFAFSDTKDREWPGCLFRCSEGVEAAHLASSYLTLRQGEKFPARSRARTNFGRFADFTLSLRL